MMKKLLLALSAVVAIAGSANAADLAARPYTKAPPAPVAPSWTGFYLFGGGGGGIWSANTSVLDSTGACALCGFNQTQGGDGWFGTVGGGYDLQFANSWVAGVFGDAQFGSLRGTIQDQTNFRAGREKMTEAWAAGVRVGYLVAPNVLSYVNAGYSGSHWSGTTLFDTITGGPAGFHTDGFDRTGWFVGGGVENNLDIFGIQMPGLFMKTEYRAAYYDTKTITEVDDASGLASNSITFKPWVQTISTSLVYRFNWTGPVVAKY